MLDPSNLIASYIPDFNHEGMLPPMSPGDPTSPYRSPYHVSFYDLVCRFGTSDQRCDILRGFVHFRHNLFRNGFSGFQWIDGSFMQNLTGREPNDIDVVTFVEHNINEHLLKKIIIDDKLITHTGSKKRYCCDSYMVDISYSIERQFIVEHTAYWYSLFSHTRDNIWKGMIQIDLPESAKEFDFYMALIRWRQQYELAH